MVDAGGTCILTHVSRPLYHCALDADIDLDFLYVAYPSVTTIYSVIDLLSL